MLIIPHMLAGAAIGTLVPNPYLAFPLGIASHYALDALPHWDTGQVRKRKADGGVPEQFERWEFPFAALDILFALALTWYFWQSHGQAPGVLAGGLGGLLPDALDNVPFWSPRLRKLPLFAKIASCHEWAHYPTLPRRELWLGIISPTIVVILALGWLLS